MRKIFQHLKKWNSWRKANRNGWSHKLKTLFYGEKVSSSFARFHLPYDVYDAFQKGLAAEPIKEIEEMVNNAVEVMKKDFGIVSPSRSDEDGTYEKDISDRKGK